MMYRSSNQQKDTIRLIFFADTHLGFDYPVRPRIERRRRGDDFFQNFHRVLKFAALEGADLVIHGGDLFFRSKVPTPIIDLVYEHLLEFAGHGIPLFIVPGNHERSRLPQLEKLNHPLIHVFDKPRSFDISINHHNVCISGFPFHRHNIRKNFLKQVAATEWQRSPADLRLLCMHQTVEGAKVGPSDYTFTGGDDVIPFDYLSDDFDLYLSGHIHRRQILSARQGDISVIYPGSTERTSFAEKEEPKGFFDIVLQNENGKWITSGMTFKKLPTRPMVDLTLDPSVTKDNLDETIRQKAKQFQPDSIVRLRLFPESQDLRQIITSEKIRELLPDTMNFQYGLEFYKNRYSGKRRGN